MIFLIVLLGASMYKYTTPLPCITLSESDSKLYIKFGFCEGKNQRQLKNSLIYIIKQFMFPNFFKKSLHILEDSASSVQVNKLNT